VSDLTAGSVGSLLSPRLLEETESVDLAILATNVPYDNNYFYETTDHRVVLSFSGWNRLTELPITNGLVFLLAGIIADEVGIGMAHNESIGCVNDFMWDKRVVDTGMRAAFFCEPCLESVTSDTTMRAILTDLNAMLDALSRASRARRDILDSEPAAGAGAAARFDIFVCYNSDDKELIGTINAKLRRQGVKTWFDEERLPPGRPWQEMLEKEIAIIDGAAVFAGKSGLGPWQSREVRAFLNELATRECPVIPVLLPEAPKVPDLPLFLRDLTWIDLRSDFDRSFERLIAAARAERA
jgi:nucleotide-binding universal stress UspA family protein